MRQRKNRRRKKRKKEEEWAVAILVVSSIFEKVHLNGIDSLVVPELRLLIRFKYNDDEEKTQQAVID
eukprot:3802383-Ditylum_brightwellii.AAC.1